MSFQRKSIKEFIDDFDLRQYVSFNYGSTINSGKDYIMMQCPFHSERTASCAVYKDSYHCFGSGCQAHGTSLDFLTKVSNLSVKDILEGDMLASYVGNQKTFVKKPVVYKKVECHPISKYNQNLLGNEEKKAYLYNRHFDTTSIAKSMIGYTENVGLYSNFVAPRYSIPVYDEQHNLITVRYRIDPAYDKKFDEPKYLAHPKTPVYLYNSHITNFRKDIVVVGSELDAAFLYFRFGIAAIAPPGEGNFKEEWAHLLKSCNVLVWYDYDYAGIMASIKTYNILRYFCNQIKIYNWSGEFKNKDDVCDFVTAKSIERFVDELEKYDVKAHY